MIWATTDDVRTYLRTSLPDTVLDEDLARDIERAARTLDAKVIRWPVLDENTGRALDVGQRGHIVAAVSEVIRARRKAEALEEALGGDGIVEIIAAGGSIKAQSLSVSGGSKSGGGGGALIGKAANRLPAEAVEALQAAGLIGGSVAGG